MRDRYSIDNDISSLSTDGPDQRMKKLRLEVEMLKIERMEELSRTFTNIEFLLKTFAYKEELAVSNAVNSVMADLSNEKTL